MNLNIASLMMNKSDWEDAGIKLPKYNIVSVAEKTAYNPIWLHLGAGNIFRGFIASLQQKLLNEGLCDRGIIAAETFDYDIIDKIYRRHDNLTLNVSLNSDGSSDCEVIGSITEAIKGDCYNVRQIIRAQEVAASEDLQLITLTVTEKGYALYDSNGDFLPLVRADIENGPDKARSTMAFLTALLCERYSLGKSPVAVVSLDNCSHNGDKLRDAVMTIAEAWVENGFVHRFFLDYLTDGRVSFPLTMIDKITPRPSKAVERKLIELGVGGMEPIVTDHNTYIAPFVNAERPQYLVIEDDFPNGRPPLEHAGVYFCDRETVNMAERMKVTTCLNPLHTALAVYGCMLGYNLICDEMKDEELVKLIKKLGYDEGLPVVTDPKIISPKAFIDEVVNERLPNPFMPDSPQRIATDTSQKVGIRFGETIKSYAAEGKAGELVAIPLAIAGWLRYLLAVDDNLEPIEVSSDPLKDELQGMLAGIEIGKPESVGDKLLPILKKTSVFGSNLAEVGLADRIEGYFKELIAGKGAVRETLKRHLA